VSGTELILLIVISFLLALLFLGFFIHKKTLTTAIENNQLESKKILDQAQQEADQIIKTALYDSKDELRKRKRDFDEESKKKKTELNKLEQNSNQKQKDLEIQTIKLKEKEKKTEKIEQKLLEQENQLLRTQADYELAITQTQKKLEKVANMSAEKAKEKLIETVKITAKKKAQEEIKEIENQTLKEAKQKAQEILSLSVQRMSSEYVNDTTVTVVQLPNEEMKGRIIGREGRNIRAVEQFTGVDLIIDDTPEAVVVSSFNPIRREIAKLSLEKLIEDGRIHPSRIEETVNRVKEDFNSTIKEYGEQAAFDVGVTDLHPHILELLGKLRFVSTDVQSVLQHSVETAHICATIAAEIGLDPNKASRAGLLHDIGKADNNLAPKDHAKMGADLCEKYGEHEDIVDAVYNHHSDNLLHAQPLAIITGAANTLSSNRPGARKELLAKYIKRLETIETIATNMPNVKNACVLQAGKLVRIFVEAQHVSDGDMSNLAHEVKSRIKQELTFPGQIKITVIKENKDIAFAS
jgi:ribonucrease Y